MMQNNSREVRLKLLLILFILCSTINMYIILQSMSPGSATGMSPTFNNENTPDFSMMIQTRLHPRPPSNSPPLTPNSQNTQTDRKMIKNLI